MGISDLSSSSSPPSDKEIFKDWDVYRLLSTTSLSISVFLEFFFGGDDLLLVEVDGDDDDALLLSMPASTIGP